MVKQHVKTENKIILTLRFIVNYSQQAISPLVIIINNNINLSTNKQNL